jgi:hypothetical protein
VRKLKKIAVNPVIVELNETSNSIFMQLDMCILTNEANLNKAQFTDDFIDGVVENKDKYIGMPLVASRNKLENGKYKELTHEFNSKTNQLNTEMIGSYSNFWKEESDGVLKLMGSAKVYKRFPAVCDAIKELYESNELKFSCEVLVSSYGENAETGVRSIPYSDGTTINELFGNCLVSYPAEVRASATLLIAEALEKDLGKGTNDFNKGNEIKFHIESASIKIDDISAQIYNILNPINPRTEYRDYRYWIRDLYNDKVILGDWDTYETYWSAGYSIQNDVVVLDAESDWVEGKIGFIPSNVNINTLLSEKDSLQSELNNKINEIKEVQKQMKTVEELQAELVLLEEQNKQLDSKVKELNDLVVSQEGKVKELEANETELSAQVDALKPYKEQVETAESEAKKAVLTEKFGKLLSEDTLKSDEVKTAIEELNEQKLNEIVVAEVLKGKGIAPAAKKDVVVIAAKEEDLLVQDRKSRLYASK